MFEHIRNWLPWRERARRKAEFVKKLRNPGHGTLKIRFKDIDNVPVGAVLTIANNETGDVLSAVLTGTDSWLVAGTSMSTSMIKTSIELEDFLTEMRYNADQDNNLVFVDGSRCLNL